jgi:hypothetical protein
MVGEEPLNFKSSHTMIRTGLEQTMFDRKALAELLRADLDRIPVPEGYEGFRKILEDNKPTRKPPIIRESPENKKPAAGQTG